MTKKLIPVLILLLLILAGCTTTVASLKENPARYAGQDVSLSGEAVQVIKVPFTELRIVRFEDHTGGITLFTTNEREKGDNFALNAFVVGYDGSTESADKSVKTITDFLKEKEILSGRAADAAARKSLEIIESLSDAGEGSYFLIEK